MISCCAWRLYVIIDRSAVGEREVRDIAAAAIRGGADVIQLRDKSASTRALIKEAAELLPLTQAAGIPLIINDRADVAVAVGAEGVHLGQDDLSVPAARKLLGEGKIVGKSTHSLEQALDAEREGADYVAVGPIHPTPTKPDYPSVGLKLIGEIKACIHRPMVAIGGIDQATLPEVLGAGAECVAVVRAVCGAPDPEAAAQELKHMLTHAARATV